MRRFVLLIGVLAIAPWVFGQNTPTDSQTLRALLQEVRQLRHDLHTTTVTAQRVQIVLYRLQLQEAAAARASKASEEAHVTLANLVSERKGLTARIEQADDLRSRTQDTHERKAIEEELLPELKRHVEQLAAQEQQWNAKVNEAEAQLTAEQQKLDALHTLLDQLDQALDSVGRKDNTSSR